MGIGRQLAGAFVWLERRALVALAIALFAWVLARGDFRGWRWPALAATVGLTLLLASRLARIVRRRFAQPPAGDGEDWGATLQLELLLVSAVYLLIHLTGEIESPLYPLLWILLAAVGGLDPRRRNTLLVVLLAWCLELLPLSAAVGLQDVPIRRAVDALGWRLPGHLAAIVGFPFLSKALIWAMAQTLRLAARREAHELRIRHDLERQQWEHDAQRYRLDGSVTELRARERSAEKRIQSSVRTLKQRVHSLLVILYEALRPHTVAFFLLTRDGRSVTLMDSLSDLSPKLVHEPLPAGKGVIGAILKNRDTISFNHLREDSERFNYYESKVGLRTFMGVPLLAVNDEDRPQLRGVLLADRTVDVAFGADDENLLKSAAQELIRSMDTERVLSATEQLSGLLDASEQLNRVVHLSDVVDTALVQVCNLHPAADFAAIALRENGRTYLAGVQAKAEFEAFKQAHLQRDIGRDSLCCQAIQTRSILPTLSFHKRSRERRRVFGKALEHPDLESLKCLPLIVAGSEGRESGEEAIGVLVIGSQQPGLFPENPKDLANAIGPVEILANMVATNIQNAQRFEQLERLATTDGLTGLHNHRRFKEMLDEAVAESLRYARPLSIILADIDHFKQVNDSYGHPMGDEVLRRSARVLSELARAADKVCRYGGEEFVVILPETEQRGARMLAERFREAIEQQRFASEGGDFQVTLSLGICTMPSCARHRQELIDRADQALYRAKRTGRNRTVHFADIAGQAVSGA